MTNRQHTEIEPLLVGIPKAAQVLGIGKTTMWEMVNNEEIPHVRIRGRVLIRVSDLRERAEQIEPERATQTA